MQLSSPAFVDNSSLPLVYTCKGKAVNPPLVISGVPQAAKSLALILHDPDAVGGRDFLHWAVWNIAPTTTEIAEASVPAGALQGTNDYPATDYGPPCPPQGTGTHRYILDLYALDTTLDLPPGADRQTLEAALEGHVVVTAHLTGIVAS